MSTRIAMVLAVAMLVLLACRPSPSDPVDYLHREDAIIIQMLSVDANASEIERRSLVPELTLYGDGTLIYLSEGIHGPTLYQVQLAEDAIDGIVETISDEGFLDFFYDQPAPEGSSGQPSTYVYAHTLERANAVVFKGLDSELPEDAGDEFDPFRSARKIINQVQAEGLDTSYDAAPAEYSPASVTLLIEPLGEAPLVDTVLFLPLLQVNLAFVAPLDGGLVEHRVDGELALTLWTTFAFDNRDELTPTVGPLYQQWNGYLIKFVPLLPYHENFPEFDLE